MKLFTFNTFFAAVLFICCTSSAFAEAELTCSVNVPSLTSSNGCCTISDAPTSSYGDVEFMWAVNNNGSIQPITGWSTNQDNSFCPTEAGYYRICTRVVGCNEVYESSDVYCEPMSCGTIDGIYFYDQSTDSPAYGPIVDGEQIDFNDLPNNYYLVAQTTGAVESVTFWVDGYSNTENVIDYTFPSGGENDNNWTGGIGTHNLDVNAYSADDAGGNHCGQIWLTFDIIGGIDAPTQPSCSNGSFIWTNNIDVTNLSGSYGIPDADLRMKDGDITTFTIPGPYPTEFNSAITLSIDEAISFDAYLYRVNVSQSNEQWKLVFKKDGNVVYETEYTQDTPDNVITGETIGSLDQDFTLPNGTDEILIVHYEDNTYGNGSVSPSSNSVAPSSVCISYTTACQNVTDPGAISAVASVCENEAITIVNDALPTGGSGDLEFIWLFNQNETNPNNAETIESNTSALTITPTESGYYRRCARRSGCSIYDGESNWIFIEVDSDCQEPCNLSVDAGLDLETCGEELTISAAISGASTCFNGCEHEVTAPERCGNSELFVFYINDAPGGQYFSSDNASFVQYENGTAKFTADATNGTDNVSIDITYSDKTTVSPIDSPKENICESTETNGWVYYQTTSGTVVSENHGTFSLSRKGPSFQLGNSAMHIAPGFGASGWLYLDGGDGTYTDGDVNIELNPACEPVGGNDNISILWSNGSTDESITVNSPGTYSVTVTDCNGCVATDEVIVSGCTEIPTGTTMTDFSIECGEDIPNDAPVFSSSCDDDLDVTFNEEYIDLPCGHEIIRSWFATDDCANQSETITQTITIVDNTNPVFTSTPNDTIISSINDLPDPGSVQATDNCGMVIMEFFESVPTDDCDGQVLRTWTAIDACGNAIDYTQTITIYDSENPTIVSAPADMTIDCEEVPYIEPVFEDNCDEDLEIAYEQSSEENGDTTIITNTWTATDNNGNSVSVTQIITVNNPGAPILVGVPADTTVECDEIPEPVIVTAEHDCEDLEVTFSEEITEGCEHTITRTYTATDSEGNTVSATQIITVLDTTAPTFLYLPNDTTVECGNVFAAPVLIATDNCDEDIEVILSQFGYNGTDCSGVLTRVYSATDHCGNEVSHTQYVTIIDNVAPTASNIPADLTINCGESIPNDVPTFEDNCDEDLTVSFDETQTDNGDDLIITRIWTALDACGNETSVSQVLTVIQSEAISLLNVPQDATVECNDIPAPANVEASNSSTVLFSENISGVCPYTITRTWSATNDCGNTATATQTILVEDNTAPAFVSLPEDLNATCGNVPPASILEATDLCGGDVSISISQFGYNGIDCSGVLTRIYTATDNCGNSVQHTQTVTISDDVAPVASNVPADLTFDCGGTLPSDVPSFSDNCAGDIAVDYEVEETTVGMTTTYIRTWTASDECGNATTVSQTVIISGTSNLELIGVPADLSVECNDIPNAANVSTNDGSAVSFEETISGDCPYFITRTWSATNDCGGDVSATQTITVEDNTAPTFTNVPSDMNASCGNVPAAGSVEVFDLCDQDVTISVSQFGYNGVDCSGVLTRIYTATDNCGNTAQHTQSITISDDIAPVASNVPADLNLDCGGSVPTDEPSFSDNCAGDISVDYTIEENTDGITTTYIRTWTASDECGNATTVSQTVLISGDSNLELIGVPADATVECNDIPNASSVTTNDGSAVSFNETISGDCPYYITRTWSATNDCGGDISASQVITVQDVTAPVLSNLPSDITVNCGEVPGVILPTATDICDNDVSVTLSQFGYNGVDCSGTLNRKFTATDDCGNVAEYTQVITIVDNIAPTFNGNTSDMTVECDNIPSAGQITATDNCSDVILEFNEFTSDGCPFTVTRTWTATDFCGNSSSLTQVITVEDSVAPELIGVPADLTTDCADNLPDPANVTATDACDSGSIVNFSEEIDGNTIIRTWTATDACGNTSTASQIITIMDNGEPILQGVPNDLTVECDNIPVAANVTATDGCSAATVSFDEVIGDGCPYTITRTWTATDAAGNTAQASQTITVEDTQAPLFSNIPADLSLSCSELPEPANVTATDNCGGNVDISLEETTDYSDCPYVLTRTWTATDECGNTATATQLISLIDNEAPELVNFEAAIQVQCDDTDGIFIEAVDNCSAELDIIIVQDQFFSGACYGTIERTYLIQDACGNSTTAVQFLFLNDDEDPVYVETPETEITIECGDDIPALEMPVAIDNCDIDVDIEVSVHVSNDGICPYVITRVFIASDDCGNNQKFVQIINVNQGVIGDDENAIITSSPNPVQGNAKVAFAIPTNGEVLFTVTNSMGQETQMIMEGDAIGGALNEFDLVTQNWESGVYYLKLFYDGKFTSHRIMKIK